MSTIASADGPSSTFRAARRKKAPAPGEYTLHLWLRDEAGNASSANGVDVPLRWDDVAYDPNDQAVQVRREMEAAFGRQNVPVS